MAQLGNTHDIMRYDLKTDTYYCIDRFSQELEDRIRYNLGDDLRPLFDKFMLDNWGKRPDGEEDKIADAMTKYTPEQLLDVKVSDKNAGVEIADFKDTSTPVSKLLSLSKDDSLPAMTDEELGDNDLFFDFFDGGVDV